MGRTTFTIADLERELVQRIAALDGSAYAQDARIGEWHEASIPLSVVGEPQSIGHLSFNVFVESGRNSTLDRDAGRDGYIKLASDIAVIFAYHIRPLADGTQLADQRSASDAALDVARAILALPQADFVAFPVSIWRPSISANGEWMLVRLDFLAIHDLNL